MSKSLDIIIKATTKGLNDTRRLTQTISDGFKKGRLAVKAFNSTARGADRTLNSLSSGIKGLVGAYLGFEGLSLVTTVVKNADLAIFNMSSSVAAANREFENIGSLDDWEKTINRLSSELVIYSDTALKSAVSRTIDMTKRLGLSKKQMEEVIKRSADLGAGKVELVEAIERVTAALRGEAESSEYLALTLNENYVKAWYRASAAHKKAWKDLTDIEKAQIRYQVLLEQSNSLQGKAAASAETFGGALMLINKEMENAIVNNKDVADAMTDIADALRENSGEIGKLVAQFVGLIGKTIQFGIEYKNMLLVIAGTGVAILLISKLAMAAKGLNAAWAIMTGVGIVPWFGAIGTAVKAVTAQVLALSIAAKGFIALAVVKLIHDLYRVNKAFWGWRDAAKAAKEAQDGLFESTDRIMKKYREFRNVKIPDDIAGQSYKDLERLNAALSKSIAYWRVWSIELSAKAEETNWLGKPTEEALGAKKMLGPVLTYLDEIIAASRETKAALAKITKPDPGGGGKDGPTDEERKKILKDQARLEQQLAAELIEISGDKWTVLKNKAIKHYEDQVKLAHGNKKLLAQAEKVYTAAIAGIYEDRQKEILSKEKKLSVAQIKSQNERLKEMTRTALASLQSSYSKAEISLSSYFKKRKTLIENQYQYEADKLREQLDTETDDVKKIQLEDDLFKLKQAHARALIALKDEELAAETTLAENKASVDKILSDMKERNALGVNSAMSVIFNQEKADLDQRHQEEKERLEDLTKIYEAELEKRKALKDAADMHKIEKKRLLADQERRLHLYRLGIAADLAGSMSDIFDNLYEATGKKHKEFFYLAKAAAIAEATINAYAAANTAWKEGGWLGKIQAAITLAGAMANVAKIKAQTLATGGSVHGYSPTSTSDNIPLWGTAGEFMHPVHIVKELGLDFMEFIRRGGLSRTAARKLMAGVPSFSIPLPRSFALAAGGSVPSMGPAGSPAGGITIEMNNVFNGVDASTARDMGQDFEERVQNVFYRMVK